MSLDENKAGAAAVDPDDFNAVVDAVTALQQGGGGSLPDGWTANDHEPPDGEQDMDTGGNSTVGGQMKLPNGDVVCAYDGNGRLEFYYPGSGGNDRALVINEGDAENAIAFFRAGSSSPVLVFNGITERWEFSQNVSYQGNDPLAIIGGGLDLGTYTIDNVSDPSTDQQAATKKYVDDAIAALLP